MIDWSIVSAELSRFAAHALPARLLSIGLPLPRWPAPGWRADAVFWQRPDASLRLAGCGAALEVVSAGDGRFAALAAAYRGLLSGWRHSALARPHAFVGFAFAPNPSDGAPLSNARLWIPELLLCEERGAVTLTLSTSAAHAATALTRWQTAWQTWRPHAAAPAPTITALDNPLADQAFLARGRAALRAIATGKLEKLVLTRCVELRADAPINPATVLDTLAARHPNCAIFGVGHAGKTFLGAAPETLLALDGAHVHVDALAGTAWHASARALGDDKNRREHDFVARAIADGLGAHCRDIVLPAAPEVMRLGDLTHLRRRVDARRDADVGVFDLIGRLHPTPAVGGAPTPAALDWLERHGDRRAAWYTGGIGWLDAHGDAEIAVALRCGLIDGRSIALYAGAGFVAGSDPEQELAETEAKLSAMRAALLADTASRAAA